MEHKILSTKKRLFIRDAFLTVQVGHQSEVPLHSQRGIDKERLVVIGIVDEVVAHLNLGTQAQMVVKVVPELGLGEDNEHTVTIMVSTPILTTPEVDESGEGALLVGEGQAPDTGQLEAGIGVGVVVALEELLIHELYRPGL